MNKFTASRRQICISVEVFLQLRAVPRLVSEKLIVAYQVQQVLRQQPGFAGRYRTSTPHVSYADTHRACISVTEVNTVHYCAAHICKFWGCAAANFCISGGHILHREGPT
jgi:hypothetical protein